MSKFCTALHSRATDQVRLLTYWGNNSWGVGAFDWYAKGPGSMPGCTLLGSLSKKLHSPCSSLPSWGMWGDPVFCIYPWARHLAHIAAGHAPSCIMGTWHLLGKVGLTCMKTYKPCCIYVLIITHMKCSLILLNKLYYFLIPMYSTCRWPFLKVWP